MTSHMLTSTNPSRKAIFVLPCTMLMVLMVPMETSVTRAKKDDDAKKDGGIIEPL